MAVFRITIDDIDSVTSVSISWSPPVSSNHPFFQGLEPDASEEAQIASVLRCVLRFGQVVS